MKRTKSIGLAGVWLASLAAAYLSGGRGERQAAQRGEHVGGEVAAQSAGAGQEGVAVPVPGRTNPSWAVGAGKVGEADTPEQVREAALARLRNALALPNNLDRGKALLAELDNLDSAGMAQAYQMIRSMDDGFGSRGQLSWVMYAWARKDPLAALAFAKENGSDRGVFTALSSWAQVSPDEAIAYAANEGQRDEHGTPVGDNWAMVGVVSGLLRSDPGKAAEALMQMGKSQARGNALDMVLQQYWKDDPDNARTWVARMPDPVLRAGAAERLGVRLADSNPQDAVKWMQSLPDAESRSRAAQGIVERWARQDANAAGAWVKETFAQGPESDGVRARFATSIDRDDPQAALAWAATVTDSTTRERTMATIAKNWVRREGDAARALLLQMPDLPAGVRARYQAP